MSNTPSIISLGGATAQRPRFETGTLVRLWSQTGIFRITTPARWGGPNHAVPTRYNVVGCDGRCIEQVSAHAIRALSEDEVSEAKLRGELDQPASERMWPVLGKLRRDADPSVRPMITRCWSCKTPLNTLHHPICPKCRGILCKCGGCRCNWPYSSRAHHLATSPGVAAAQFLPR